jgi:hypothetical protein
VGEVVEGGRVEVAAFGELPGPPDQGEQEAVGEAVGDLGVGEAAQQLLPGDVADDADVSAAGHQGVAFGAVLQWVAIPGLADHR